LLPHLLLSVWSRDVQRITYIAFLSAAWLAPPAGAQTKVAVINVEEVFARYKRPAVLEEQIRARQKGLLEEAETRRQQIDRKRQELQAFKPGTPDYEERNKGIRREEIEFQVWRTLGEEEIKLQHKNSFRLIYDDVRAGVAELARQRGIDLVLTFDTLTEEAPDSQALRQQILLQKVIYWSPQIDITADLIELINARFDKQSPPLNDPSGDASRPDPDQRLADAVPPSSTPPGSARVEEATGENAAPETP